MPSSIGENNHDSHADLRRLNALMKDIDVKKESVKYDANDCSWMSREKTPEQARPTYATLNSNNPFGFP